MNRDTLKGLRLGRTGRTQADVNQEAAGGLWPLLQSVNTQPKFSSGNCFVGPPFENISHTSEHRGFLNKNLGKSIERSNTRVGNLQGHGLYSVPRLMELIISTSKEILTVGDFTRILRLVAT